MGREVRGDVGREVAKLFLVGGNRPGRDQIFRRGNRAGSKKNFERGE